MKRVAEFKELMKKTMLGMVAASDRAILEHRATGNPLVYWEGGKVVKKDPFSVKTSYERS